MRIFYHARAIPTRCSVINILCPARNNTNPNGGSFMRMEQLETPALILDLDVAEQNMAMMQEYMDFTGLALRPHYKSSKCVSVAQMQIRNGAKGITCAKLSEAEDLILSGVEDVLIANQIVEPSKIARLAYLAGCCRLTVCVDRAENILQLQAAATVQDTKIHVYVEYDVSMRRCGVDTPEEFLKLAKLVESCDNLVFDGIQAYAGHLSHEEDYEVRRAESARVEEARVRALKQYVEEHGLLVREVSGISTGTIEFFPKDTVYTEAQVGSYIYMDTGYHALKLKFQSALFVLTQIVSKNEFIVTDAGTKAISVDQHPPIFRDYPDRKVSLSEEHGRIPSEGLDIEIGDKLLMIPSHSCTTMNLYDTMYLVRGGKVVDRVRVDGRGKSL